MVNLAIDSPNLDVPSSPNEHNVKFITKELKSVNFPKCSPNLDAPLSPIEFNESNILRELSLVNLAIYSAI